MREDQTAIAQTLSDLVDRLQFQEIVALTQNFATPTSHELD
ncbi:hypothetical protein [Leptolyngbya sp. FACHB-711]|nr:hypothetical protein [Leptolyngbya sp. FACHB-711]